MRIRKWHVATLVGVLILTAALGVGVGTSVVRGQQPGNKHPTTTVKAKVDVNGTNGGCAAMSAQTSTDFVVLPPPIVGPPFVTFPVVVNQVFLPLPCDSHVLVNWAGETTADEALVGAFVTATCVPSIPGTTTGCVIGTTVSCAPGVGPTFGAQFLFDTRTSGDSEEVSAAKISVCDFLTKGTWRFDFSAVLLDGPFGAVDFRALTAQAFGVGPSFLTGLGGGTATPIPTGR